MQEFPRTGGTSNDGRAAPHARLFATFKLATPYVAMVQRRAVAGEARTAANVNRVGLVTEDWKVEVLDLPRPERP
jgi:hypothetical protein